MAANQIRADYDQLRTIQNMFTQNAEAIAQRTSDVRSKMDTLQGGDWIGKAATAFYQEMNGSVLPSLKRLHSALQEAARTTKEISDVMKQAEDDASNVFHM